MGIVNYFKDFKMFRNARSVSLSNGMQGMGYFSWVGDVCSPGFTIDLSQNNNLDKAYNICSPLSTCINRCATAQANGKWKILDKEENDVTDKYKNIHRLLRRPNPLQSWQEFMIQLDTYRLLYGETFVTAVIPLGFSSAQNATSLWVVNPKYVEIELTNKLYKQSKLEDIVLKYYINIDGKREELHNVLHIRDTYQNINFSPSDIRGCSRVKGLEYDIRNIMQAVEAIYSLNKDRGAMGILSNSSKDAIGSKPMTPSQKEDIQSQYNYEYGLGSNQRKVIITDASLSWQPMTFSVRDLMLYEGIKSNIERVSDAIGYPFEMLANEKGSTFSNKDKAEKWFYQNTVITMSEIYDDCFTSYLGLDELGVDLVIDFSHIECLQESKKEEAERDKINTETYRMQYESGAITFNEYREALGYKPIEGGDIYYEERDKRAGEESNTPGEGEEAESDQR